MKFESLYSFKNLTFHFCASEKGITSLNLLLTPERIVANNPNAIILNAINQLDEYFQCKRTTFSVELDIKATEFQKKVWNTLLDIPHGTLATYQEVALLCGGKSYARAVAMACHYNPIMIIIPCHRVVARQGKIGGFASGISLKKELLDLEQKQLSFFPAISTI